MKKRKLGQGVAICVFVYDKGLLYNQKYVDTWL